MISEDDPLGPLDKNTTDHEANLAILQRLSEASISFNVVSFNVGILGSFAYKWTLRAVFSFVPGGGLCDFRLSSQKTIQSLSGVSQINGVQLGMSLTLLFLSSVSIFLAIRSLVRSFTNCRRVSEKAAELHDTHGKLLTLKMQLNFFELWNAWNLVGDLCLAVGCLLSLFQLYTDGLAHYDFVFNLFLGLGTFFSCVNILRYIEFNRSLNVLVSTLRLSFGRVIPFIVSFLPIFFGLTILSVSLFSQYTTRFGAVDTAAVSLFALILGDDVHATFDELTASYPYLWLSRIFLYVYCILAITAVLNVCIFLIEDAYHAAKLVDRKSTIDRHKSVGVVEGKAGGDHHDAEDGDDDHDRTLADVINLLEKHEGGVLTDVASSTGILFPLSRRRRALQSVNGADDNDDARNDETNPLLRYHAGGKEKEEISSNGDDDDGVEQRISSLQARMIETLNKEFDMLRRELRTRK